MHSRGLHQCKQQRYPNKKTNHQTSPHTIKNLIKKKPITHDHVSYIINRVLVPQIEFLSQFHFLELHTWESLLKSYTNTISTSPSLHTTTLYTIQFTIQFRAYTLTSYKHN